MPRIPDADDLDLLIDNTQGLYRQKEAIKKNLAKHVCRGKFSKTGAEKGFKYLTDAAVKEWYKDMGGRGSLPRGFGMKARKDLNKALTKEFMTQAKACLRGEEWGCNDLGDAASVLAKPSCQPGGELSGTRRRKRRAKRR